MTVRELIVTLLDMDMDATVVICRAPGGDNGYSPLAEATPGEYMPRHTWDGEFNEIQERLEYPGAVALYPTY